MKLGVMDVGGGLRGVYAAGIFDFCLAEGIRFDVCVGVSAGSAYITSYAAGQLGRNFPFYTEYPFRKDYMGFQSFRRNRSYLNLDYIYGTLSNSGGENPLDYQAIRESPVELVIVACDARTGKARYFSKADLKPDDCRVLMASSAIPFICRPYGVEGIPYYDGALGDPVPVEKAFEAGCERVVVILSKPRNTLRTPGKDPLFARLIQRRYPLAADSLRRRASRYNDGVRRATEYERQGRVLILAPDDTCGVDTLTRDRAALRALYQKGQQDAREILNFVPADKIHIR